MTTLIERTATVYHICVAAPFYLETLQEDCLLRVTNWTINSEAKAGERVLFYITQTVQAIVARGVVLKDAKRDPESGWPDHFMADIGELEMLEQRISRRAILEAIPGWGYFKQPHRSCRIPQQHVAGMERLLRGAYV